MAHDTGRSSLVLRQLYAELRRALGNSVSARDILRHAYALQRLHSLEPTREGEEPEDDPEHLAPGTPFDMWPVDIAMRDGGWMILEHEVQQIARQSAETRPREIYRAAVIRLRHIWALELDHRSLFMQGNYDHQGFDDDDHLETDDGLEIEAITALGLEIDS